MHSIDERMLSKPDSCIVVKGAAKGMVLKIRRYGTFCAYDQHGKKFNFYDVKNISLVRYYLTLLKNKITRKQ